MPSRDRTIARFQRLSENRLVAGLAPGVLRPEAILDRVKSCRIPIPTASTSARSSYLIARSASACSHCGLKTRLVALALPRSHETLSLAEDEQDGPEADSWDPVPCSAILFYVGYLPDDVQQRLEGFSKTYRPAVSAAAQGVILGEPLRALRVAPRRSRPLLRARRRVPSRRCGECERHRAHAHRRAIRGGRGRVCLRARVPRAHDSGVAARGHLLLESQELQPLGRKQRAERCRVPCRRAHSRRAQRTYLRSFRSARMCCTRKSSCRADLPAPDGLGAGSGQPLERGRGRREAQKFAGGEGIYGRVAGGAQYGSAHLAGPWVRAGALGSLSIRRGCRRTRTARLSGKRSAQFSRAPARDHAGSDRRTDWPQRPHSSSATHPGAGWG